MIINELHFLGGYSKNTHKLLESYIQQIEVIKYIMTRWII